MSKSNNSHENETANGTSIEDWFDNWRSGVSFGAAFTNNCEILCKETSPFKKSRAIIAGWAKSFNLFPMYRISEVCCPGDPSVEGNRFLYRNTEVEGMGEYLLDAIYISKNKDFLIFHSHEDWLALGKCV